MELNITCTTCSAMQTLFPLATFYLTLYAYFTLSCLNICQNLVDNNYISSLTKQEFFRVLKFSFNFMIVIEMS